MEDRLPILIQKQLDAEIHQRPLLFPWETEVDEYDTTDRDFGHPIVNSIPSSPLEVTIPNSES